MTNAQHPVLVVESDWAMIQVISINLRGAGYCVRATQSGREALELAQSLEPLAMIVNSRLDRYTGIDICQRVRQIPSTSQLPTILLTSEESCPDESEIREADVSACFHKPFRPDDLVNRINEIAKPYWEAIRA